nr:MAG TPA: hypothetical protein [Caudoviricetes sp.]
MKVIKIRHCSIRQWVVYYVHKIKKGTTQVVR